MSFRLVRPRSTHLIALLLLSACAQPITKYQTPQGVPTARLLMRGTLEPGDRYGIFLFDSADDCKGMHIAAVGTPGADPAAIKVSAQGMRTVDVYVSKANHTSCRVRWSFTPTAGRSYLVSAQSTATGCSAMIFDATDVDAMKPEASLLRRDVPGNACVALANSRSISQMTANRDRGSVAGPSTAAKSPTGIAEDDLKALTEH
jgi:hypothetical protein